MEFSIRHFISGRVRLHLPSLVRKRKLAEAALVWLEAQPGIKRARLNYDCASLVIEYDAKFEPVLRATLARLSVMSSRRSAAPGRGERQGSRGAAPRGAAAGRQAVLARPHAADAADRFAPDGVQRQSDRHRGQHAADAVERLSDRAAGVARVAAREPAQCRFPRYARDRGVAHAGQSAWPARSSPG